MAPRGTRPKWLYASAAVVAVGTFYLAFELGRYESGYSLLRENREHARLSADLEAERETSDELRRQLAIAETASEIDRETYAQVKAMLGDLEAKIQAQEEELVFYRGIVSPDAWPRIRKERIQKLLPQAMARANVDAWVLICRENDNDPLAIHVGCENAGGSAAFLFLKQGESVRSLALSPAGEATALRDVGPMDEVVPLERGTDLYAQVASRLAAVKPARIAVNSSERVTVADR